MRPNGKANHTMWVYYEDEESKILDQQVVSKHNEARNASTEFGPDANLSPLASSTSA